MAAWKVRVGHGWLDQTPPDVKTVLEIHQDNHPLAVLCRHTGAHLPGEESSSDIPFWPRDSSDGGTGAVASVLEAVWRFFADLENDDVDVASLVFVNFNPKTFSLNPRPDARIYEAHSLPAAVSVFCRSVAQSLHPFGMWSACEWAMISCSRAAQDESSPGAG